MLQLLSTQLLFVFPPPVTITIQFGYVPVVLLGQLGGVTGVQLGYVPVVFAGHTIGTQLGYVPVVLLGQLGGVMGTQLGYVPVVLLGQLGGVIGIQFGYNPVVFKEHIGGSGLYVPPPWPPPPMLPSPPPLPVDPPQQPPPAEVPSPPPESPPPPSSAYAICEAKRDIIPACFTPCMTGINIYKNTSITMPIDKAAPVSHTVLNKKLSFLCILITNY
ncbi:MAG: hypothetical protein ABSE76_00135 [Minisyncoccia bacterium]